MKLRIDQIKKRILPILQEAGVTRSAIFGSYVRGEERKVDLVEYFTIKPRLKPYILNNQIQIL